MKLFFLLAALLGAAGCKTASQDGLTSATEASRQQQGPCDGRARGAALDLHRKEYGVEGVHVANVKFLGTHQFGVTNHSVYLVNNTDEVDGASVLLAFQLLQNSKCAYIPFIPEDQDNIDESWQSDRAYAILPY